MLPLLLAVLSVAVSAACAMVAAYRGDRHGLYLFKPLTTVIIIVATLWLFAPAMRRNQDIV